MLVPSTRVTSAIAVEAYKKYLVVSLLDGGRVQRSLSSLFPAATRGFKGHSVRIYHDLVKSYRTDHPLVLSRVRAEFEKNQSAFRAVGRIC